MRTIIRNNYEPKNSDYHEKIVIDEAQDKKWIFDCDGVFTDFTDGADVSEEIKRLDNAIKTEGEERKAEDEKIWTEIDSIEMASDVVDIVGTYAELQQYDTSKLHDNDIIKVLADETHNGQTSYYRFGKTLGTFSYVGSEGPYYTENQIDILLSGKQDTLTAGDNISITNNVISGAYTAFTGASSVAGSAGLVPAPAVGDDTKFLSGNGLWTTVSQYSLPIASANDLGGIKVGNNLTVDPSTGVLDATNTTYSAGTNVQISAGNIISATDTTYSAFTGTDGQTAGTAGLVPAPATTDAGKFLKADGTWSTAGGGSGIVELTSADYNYPTNNPNSVALWMLSPGIYYRHDDTVVVRNSTGSNLQAMMCSLFIVDPEKDGYIAITGFGSGSINNKSVSLSYFHTNASTGTSSTEDSYIPYGNIKDNLTTSTGNYVLNAKQGKVLNDKIEGRVLQNAGAPTTATVGTIGQLYEDTTNGKLYICTDATNPYVWEEVGSGGGGASVFTNNEWNALWA